MAPEIAIDRIAVTGPGMMGQAPSLSTWSWHKNTFLAYSKLLSGKSF